MWQVTSRTLEYKGNEESRRSRAVGTDKGRPERRGMPASPAHEELKFYHPDDYEGW